MVQAAATTIFSLMLILALALTFTASPSEIFRAFVLWHSLGIKRPHPRLALSRTSLSKRNILYCMKN
jgi:hypothetical protein